VNAAHVPREEQPSVRVILRVFVTVALSEWLAYRREYEPLTRGG
jgi:hypothetical protein